MNVAFIPVRAGSKGIPNKNFRSIAGRPLVDWTVSSSLASNVDKVVVATDCVEIKKFYQNHGSSKLEIYSRDSVNARDVSSTESVIFEYLDSSNLDSEDGFLLLQATSPLTSTGNINQVLDLYKRVEKSIVSVVRSKSFIWDNNSPKNYTPLNRPRRQDFEGYLVENGAIYMSKIRAILDSQCRISPPYQTYEMSEETRVELDSDIDWIVVEKLLERCG